MAVSQKQSLTYYHLGISINTTLVLKYDKLMNLSLVIHMDINILLYKRYQLFALETIEQICYCNYDSIALSHIFFIEKFFID